MTTIVLLKQYSQALHNSFSMRIYKRLRSATFEFACNKEHVKMIRFYADSVILSNVLCI